MNKGSPEWIDLKILNYLDRQWERKGRYLSALDLMRAFANDAYSVDLEDVHDRLCDLRIHGVIEGQYAPYGTGPNPPYLLRYSRVRARL